MKERGILFQAPMVRALLAGEKTQTRRILKRFEMRAGMPEPEYASLLRCCPYGATGDRLWVREAHSLRPAVGDPETIVAAYRATDHECNAPWRPSIHMPRWACRLVLEVTAVRVERLQDISQADAIAEGIERYAANPSYWRDYGNPTGVMAAASSSYMSLWDSINGAGSWDANPWVWVIEFKRVSP